MNTAVITIVAAVITGSLGAFTGAAMRLHKRFILMEVSLRMMRRDVSSIMGFLRKAAPTEFTWSPLPADTGDTSGDEL